MSRDFDNSAMDFFDQYHRFKDNVSNVGNDDGNSYVQRKSETGIVTLEEMYEYFFNIYRLLDKAVLNISDETYKKLHSIITECRTLIFYGSNTCPFLGSWLSTKERWKNENPQLELLALVSEFNDIEEAFDYVEQEHIDALMDEFRKESGRVKLYKIHKNGKKSEIYEDFYYYKIYEIIPMELARTFGSLYKKDFPECFH